MPSESTVRFIELDRITTSGSDFSIPLTDPKDTTDSPDGTDKRIHARDLIENTSIRPSADDSVSDTLREWIQDFRSRINTLETKTQDANTTRVGVSRHATDTQAQAKDRADRVLTASNLAALGSTESLAGLIALASAQEVAEGQVGNKAITPATFFESILGDAVLGNNSWVFRIPFKNVVGDVKMELKVQVGQQVFDTMQTGANPSSNFNHIHQRTEFEITYPEQFTSQVLMVIPIPIEATPSEYTEATDFWIRAFEQRLSGATMRATRINGTSDGSEQAVCRYLAIGY